MLPGPRAAAPRPPSAAVAPAGTLGALGGIPGDSGGELGIGRISATVSLKNKRCFLKKPVASGRTIMVGCAAVATRP